MSKDTSSEHLRAELKNLADTLEEVLSSSTEKSKGELDKLRNKARVALDSSRERLGESSERIAATTREAAQKPKATCVKIHGMVWVSVQRLASHWACSFRVDNYG